MVGAETYSFGEWLKQRREQFRLTQRELAVTVFCSVAMIKKIEADERQPSPELAALLAVALKVPQADHTLFVEVARGERPVDGLWHVPGESAPQSVPLHAPLPLPKPATAFVGRNEELAQIGERLAQPNCRLLTLVGTGGIGKTRLAIAAAQAYQPAFVEGVVFVSLATTVDSGSIPEVVARCLMLALTAPPAEQVLAYLRRRSMLLVLDNCEQLEGDLNWLSDLLAAAPGVKLLATSRERLHLAEEWVYAVPELSEAADLFVETAQRVKQDFNLDAEQAAVMRICQLVDNLPLAVELAAGWTSLMSCERIADHIQRDVSILASDMRNVPERHRSVQAVFDHSWKLLSDAEQNAMMRLSVFRGGWQSDEALSVADADLLMLRRLVEKSLVRVSENSRYDLHELIRQFTAQKLRQSGFESEARQQHFGAYLALATALDAQQHRPHGMKAVARFDQEHDNLRVALTWSLDSEQTEAALHLLYHLWFYWTRRGYYHEGREWAMRAIHQAGALESTHLCIALSGAAVCCFITGQYGQAEPLALRALTMARRLEEPEALVMAMGLYTFTSVNAEQALNALHEGISLIEESGKMREFLPLMYQGAATWFHSTGRYAEAADYYQESIALFRQMDAVDMIADPLGRLGELALQEGRLPEAYDLTVESIAAAREAGYFGTFGAWGGSRLGLIQLYLGEVEAAQRSLEEALLIFEDGRDARVKQEALAILSEVVLARGDVKSAADHMAASLSICEIFYRELQATRKLEGTPDALPVDLIGLGARASLVAAAQGYDERAVTLYSIADSLRVQSGQAMLPPLLARLEESMAEIRSRLPDEVFDDAWNVGQTMSLTEAFTFVLR